MTLQREVFSCDGPRDAWYYVDKNGVKFFLKDVYLGEIHFDCENRTWFYEITGPRGPATIEWLKLNFPKIHFRDPERERVEALAAYYESIGAVAVEKYKREIGMA